MNIKAIRKKRKLTQKQLADKLGCSLQAVKFWETDRRQPQGDYKAKLEAMQ